MEYFYADNQTGFEIECMKAFNKNVAYEIRNLLELNVTNWKAENNSCIIQSIDNLFRLDINLALGVLLELTSIGMYILARALFQQKKTFLLVNFDKITKVFF